MKTTTTAIKSLIKATGLTLGLGMLTYQSGANANPLYQLFQNYNVAQQSPNDIIIDTNSQSSPPPPVNTSSADTRFECQMNGGRYKVMYRPQSQESQPYPWAIPSNLGDGWTAERRCYEISRRLEMYRPDGLLELRTGRENNYDTICVTTQTDPRCRIVLTVPPGKNPEITRDQIFQTLVSAEDGQYSQGVNAFTGGSSINNPLGQLFNGKIPQIGKPSQPRANGINLRPFLDAADGGTGAKLEKTPTNSNSRPSNSRTLNPNLFR
ncbi:COP23 domain-containing protein [Crocosphaera sp. UHCC 0190]|uniref:COP23 domain-containing protein n=1 Tax=Crocosphaera sp. UHCC 0190 TaxID=3110246 RepID=UPI002B208B86|nr:COP23 domain-containing protein [Crocosphaera sp. UHCC 0190]MEA5512037.1 COP23 domain-containing protein [Crocosphaera sp. UHCC 0190]